MFNNLLNSPKSLLAVCCFRPSVRKSSYVVDVLINNMFVDRRPLHFVDVPLGTLSESGYGTPSKTPYFKLTP
jgi:hypothetical protein